MKDKVVEGPFQLRSLKFHLATLESWIKEEYSAFVGELFSFVNSKKCKVYRKVLPSLTVKHVGIYVR